jgi:hypothetical protein
MAAGTGSVLVQANEGNRTVYLAQSYQFTDTGAHDPSTDAGLLGYADNRLWYGASIVAWSTLNQQVTLRLVGALGRTTAAGQTLPQLAGDLVLPAYSAGDPQRGVYPFLHVTDSLWLPWLYVLINPAGGTAPSSGNLTIVVWHTEYSCMDAVLAGS